MHKRGNRFTALVAALALGASACGGDDGGSADGAASTEGSATVTADSTADMTGADSSTADPSTADPSTGDPSTADSSTAGAPGSPATPAEPQPFKVMVMGDFTSTVGYTVGETRAAVRAVLDDVPGLEIVECDTQFDLNAALGCQRTAVEKDVVAVINGYGPGRDAPILAEAGIPLLGDADPTLDISFGLSSSNGAYVGLGVGAARAGCSKAGILYYEGQELAIDLTVPGIESEGMEVTATAAVPFNAPDMAPAISRLVTAGADCVILSITPQAVVQAVTAIRQSGADPTIVGFGAIVPEEVLDVLGDMAEGIVLVDIQRNVADPAPVIATIASDLKSVDADAPLTTNAVLAWATAQVLSEALGQIDGEITRDTVRAALDGVADVDLQGAVAPFSVEPLENPAFRRFFNHHAIVYRIVNGKPTVDGDFFDFGPVLESISS